MVALDARAADAAPEQTARLLLLHAIERCHVGRRDARKDEDRVWQTAELAFPQRSSEASVSRWSSGALGGRLQRGHGAPGLGRSDLALRRHECGLTPALEAESSGQTEAVIVKGRTFTTKTAF